MFESPNGQFKLEVTNTGISMRGPTAKILLGSSGIELSSAALGDLITVKTPAAKLEVGTATVSVDAPGPVKIHGGQVQLNGCVPIARVGDLVDASAPDRPCPDRLAYRLRRVAAGSVRACRGASSRFLPRYGDIRADR